MNNNNTNTGGIRFFGLLTIVFITLKLIGTITWSWWWVLSPFWIPIGLVIVIFIGMFVWAVRKDKNGR